MYILCFGKGVSFLPLLLLVQVSSCCFSLRWRGEVLQLRQVQEPQSPGLLQGQLLASAVPQQIPFSQRFDHLEQRQ